MDYIIPNTVIGTVSEIIPKIYDTHVDLDILFLKAGAPGEAPVGNLKRKCIEWLQRCNDDPEIDTLKVLGGVIKELMDRKPDNKGYLDEEVKDNQDRIKEALDEYQLSYQGNGVIVLAGSKSITKQLADLLKSGDFVSIEKEFERALENINTDPHVSITAASSIVEALCKIYIETFELAMPKKQSISPLWKTVSQHIGLEIDPNLVEDEKKILQGLNSIVDGIGALRTHSGSAHGRGIEQPIILESEARLAINAANTIVIFMMERWHKNA
ncbi:MAG: abortive infection family protein [Anaerolineales bacterium]|nr:abortive infection family protein [Anaerolineales bacterium]